MACACLNGLWTCSHSAPACPGLEDSGFDSAWETTTDIGVLCDPRSASGCTAGLSCCRSTGVDAGALYSQGIDPPYTCESPGPLWVCQGPPAGSPCDPVIDNDPYRCARGLSCCTANFDGGAFSCMDAPAGVTCSL
jgi:hypothetical protein